MAVKTSQARGRPRRNVQTGTTLGSKEIPTGMNHWKILRFDEILPDR
jgi:hypothetical protein